MSGKFMSQLLKDCLSQTNGEKKSAFTKILFE